MTIQYEKYHGTANDFVIIDADEYVPDRAALAREVCDRTSGVGADGVLFLALEAQYTPPRVIMTLVQPDGSNANMCGNGARCAAHWAARRTGAETVMIDTQAGTRRAEVRDETITIDMGTPSFAPADVPLAQSNPLIEAQRGDFAFTAVNTGVPHAVAFVDDVHAVDIENVAPPIRHADLFPAGANVTFASRAGPGTFDQRTFERGVEGETQSCGTGAVAVAAVARRLGLLDTGRPARIRPPGGDLEVTFAGGGVATLTGPVEREFAGRLDAIPGPRRLDAREA